MKEDERQIVLCNIEGRKEEGKMEREDVRGQEGRMDWGFM